MLALQANTAAQCKALNQSDTAQFTDITVRDELWLNEWIPFLFAGKHNAALFNTQVEGMSREHVFSRLEYAITLTHLVLVVAGDITQQESTAMQRVFTQYAGQL